MLNQLWNQFENDKNGKNQPIYASMHDPFLNFQFSCLILGSRAWRQGGGGGSNPQHLRGSAHTSHESRGCIHRDSWLGYGVPLWDGTWKIGISVLFTVGSEVSKFIWMYFPDAFVGWKEVIDCSDHHLGLHFIEHHTQAMFSPAQVEGWPLQVL